MVTDPLPHSGQSRQGAAIMDARRTLITAAAAAIAGHRVYDAWSRNWGAAPAERAMPLPGDDFLPASTPPATMAVTIDAPPEAVWPWLVQMGIDRAGLYTHTWVENGILRLGVTNAGRIRPEWQDLTIGTRFLFMRGTDRRPPFGPVVVAFEPNRSIVLNNGETTDPATSLGMGQFALVPMAGDRTRLLLRSRGSRTRPAWLKVFDAILVPGYQYMDIGMLRGIRDRAERTESQPSVTPLAA
jgi:uncharacterized protein YndB with AHSA1/START domain